MHHPLVTVLMISQEIGNSKTLDAGQAVAILSLCSTVPEWLMARSAKPRIRGFESHQCFIQLVVHYENNPRVYKNNRHICRLFSLSML